jgi:hypothetical protein
MNLESVTHCWLSPKQAEAYTGISSRSLERLRLTGGGPVYSKVGRLIRYNSVDLEDWMRRDRRNSTSDSGSSR